MRKGLGTALRFGVLAFLGLGLVAAFFTTTPKPWALTLFGIGLGCIAGRLRARATTAGLPARTANLLGWLCGIGLLVLAMAFAEDMFLGAWAASVSGYLLADRALAFPAADRRARIAAGVPIDRT
ncbi:hypothetical protein [Pseudoxanthomonas sp.]|uniref:hypothetical protein n=1 Tax=Pseudoxanthomonas sp. TaxID=1871049 RepID=UPI002618C9AC|nr:hypothetical protein [Pseudoxanthomonas sp.]WDS35318.1 MAG: hypothetical protein O8I58_13285 [Pseudoxanthomonas sp.]